MFNRRFRVVGYIALIIALIIGLLLPISIILSEGAKNYKQPIESVITNCTFTTGTIIAKREYCTHDCRYTFVIGFENKFTEVDIPKERYQFGIIGSQIDILTNCD